jgi:hypothetical protein
METLPAPSDSQLPAIATRVWSTEPDGPNDRAVDVWNPATGNWIPAFFKDIKKGDFYLLLGFDLGPDRCFLAGSDVKRYEPPERGGSGKFNATFVILGGAEIVQAPAIVDITPAALEITNPKRIK